MTCSCWAANDMCGAQVSANDVPLFELMKYIISVLISGDVIIHVPQHTGNITFKE